MAFTRIQMRRDTAADWTAADPTLTAGEIGVELDTGQFKIGDGTTAWTALAYAGAGGALDASGTPSAGELVRWVDATTLEGRTPAESRNDLGLGNVAVLDLVDIAIFADVHNASGVTIPAGALVTNVGSTGTNPLVAIADRTTSINVAGVAFEEIADNSDGLIQVTGWFVGIDTSGVADGDPLWLDTAGTFTDTPPTTGVVIRVGIAGVSHPTLGAIVLNLPAFEASARDTAYDPSGSPLVSTRTQGAIDELANGYQTILRVPVIVTGTTDTISAADNGEINRYTESTLVTVTIPTNAADPLPAGHNTVLFAEGAAGLTLDTTGITVAGGSLTSISQGESMEVIKTATADTWIVLGGTS